MWYYEYKDTTVGPVSDAVIQQLIHAGMIDGKTLVCGEGGSDWLPLADTPLSKQMQAPRHSKPNPPKVVKSIPSTPTNASPASSAQAAVPPELPPQLVAKVAAGRSKQTVSILSWFKPGWLGVAAVGYLVVILGQLGDHDDSSNTSGQSSVTPTAPTKSVQKLISQPVGEPAVLVTAEQWDDVLKPIWPMLDDSKNPKLASNSYRSCAVWFFVANMLSSVLVQGQDNSQDQHAVRERDEMALLCALSIEQGTRLMKLYQLQNDNELRAIATQTAQNIISPEFMKYVDTFDSDRKTSRSNQFKAAAAIGLETVP